MNNSTNIKLLDICFYLVMVAKSQLINDLLRTLTLSVE